MRRKVALTALLAATLLLGGCGGEDADLTVYSGRNEDLVGDLFDRFEDETGLKVDVRYGDSAELAATLSEEGSNSPADVFFAQDAGSLGSVESLLAEAPPADFEAIPEKYRDPQGRWIGTSEGAVAVLGPTGEALDARLDGAQGWLRQIRRVQRHGFLVK